MTVPRSWLPPVLALLVWVPSAVGQVGDAAVLPTRPPVERFVERAARHERSQQWRQAAELYQRAMRLFPDAAELPAKWQRAERLYSLARRYRDASFRDELLALDRRQAKALLIEMLDKADANYVVRLDYAAVAESGLRDLDLALGQSIFWEGNFPRTEAAGRAALREELARLPEGPVRDGRDVVRTAEEAGRICARYGMVHGSAVLLEFLSAAAEGLDPYSGHLTPNRLRDLYAMIDGNFVGLGVEVKGGADGLDVVQVLAGSPAAEAGLKAGDMLVAIDGREIAGEDAESAANRLQGPAGSVVHLGVRRGETASVLAVTRRQVTVHSIVDVRLLDETAGVGYLRLTSFQRSTARELQTAVDGLAARGMRSLVIDLRGNPGGLLDVALKVANLFIDDGVLVSTRGRTWGQTWTHRARGDACRYRFPLALLIDGGSASASEIFAGAVKDHRRGTLVGTRTFGKGSVQSIFPLRSAETGLRLTTAHFFSPTGLAYHNIGVAPNVHVARRRDDLGVEVDALFPTTPESDRQLAEAVRVVGAVQLSRN